MIRMGIFTDAHYAEGLTTCKTRTCWQSMEKVKRVLAALSDADLIVQLGDLINVSGDHETDLKNIRAMQNLLNSYGKTCLSVLGNHDVEAEKKYVFLPGQKQGYYSVDLDEVRLIVLDGCFTSEGESYEDTGWDWTDSLIPDHELQWLRETLDAAAGGAVVFCHQNLDAREGDPHVIRNAAEVRRILEESGKVMAVLQGHCHSGCRNEQKGILYHTFRALCEGNEIPCAMVMVGDHGIQIEEMELKER